MPFQFARSLRLSLVSAGASPAQEVSLRVQVPRPSILASGLTLEESPLCGIKIPHPTRLLGWHWPLRWSRMLDLFVEDWRLKFIRAMMEVSATHPRRPAAMVPLAFLSFARYVIVLHHGMSAMPW